MKIQKDYAGLLEQAHTHAREMLQGAYDAEQSFPITAASHTDFWPGDAERWVSGYLAIGNANMAQGVVHAVGLSVRENGAVPHYMSGRRPLPVLGIDTKFIDRYVQKRSGNGLEQSKAGKWVTTAYAPATFGSAAAKLVNVGLELPVNFGPSELANAHNSVTFMRQNMEGLIEAKNPNELTNNSGMLATLLKEKGSIVDLAVSASYKNSAHAIAGIPGVSEEVKKWLLEDEKVANTAIHQVLDREHDTTQMDDGVFSLESTMAAARLGLSGMIREKDLAAFFRVPDPYDKHPEQSRPSFADAIEVARLTAGGFELSRTFLRRTVAKLAIGSHMFTRYEGIEPSANAITNRAYRRQVWAPTAAEAAQIAKHMVI